MSHDNELTQISTIKCTYRNKFLIIFIKSKSAHQIKNTNIYIYIVYNFNQVNYIINTELPQIKKKKLYLIRLLKKKKCIGTICFSIIEQVGTI